MRLIVLFFTLLLVAAWSCNETEAHEPAFGADLPTSNFVVDPGKDTVLKTAGGALIAISAGTLDAGDAPTVSLEVKEAYTAEEMTRGGLIHAGDSLNSSGMIYVNVVAGQSVSIHKPLNVSIPAKGTGSDWMVYKGEAGSDALLRWDDAKPLANSPAQAATDAGKTLFQTRCASCHGGKDEVAGPPLAWITRRRHRQWLYAFTRNNAVLLWRGDGYSCYLFNRYKTPMPLFKDLSDADLSSLYHYIDNASRSVDSNTVTDHKRGYDSCISNDPNCSAVAQRTKAVSTQDGGQTDSTTAPAEAPVANYYTFAIEKHGWYSVAGKPGGAVATGDAFPAISADSLHPAAESLQACPCWCNEAAYRRADSLGRDKPANH
jgi:mono/diheme cytochrome c family protein